MSDEVLRAIQKAEPEAIWLDRKGAFLMALHLIRLAISHPYVRVERKGKNRG